MRWQDGALGDLPGSDLKCLSWAVVSIVHPVALQHLEQTSWREKHPVVAAPAPYTTILRAFWPCAMLDGDQQRALRAASFTNSDVFLLPDRVWSRSPRSSGFQYCHAPVACIAHRPRPRRWQNDHDEQRAAPTSLQSINAFERVGLGSGRCE